MPAPYDLLFWNLGPGSCCYACFAQIFKPKLALKNFLSLNPGVWERNSGAWEGIRVRGKGFGCVGRDSGAWEGIRVCGKGSGCVGK